MAGAVGLAVSLPASAARNSVEHFTVVSAKAGATLTFQSANSNQSAQTSGTVILSASQKSSGKGSLPGRALASLKGTLKERVKTKRTPSDSSPYQEIVLELAQGRRQGRRSRSDASGTKVQVGWAFPQANASFCHGPKVGKSVTAKMKRVYSAATFAKKRVTVVLKGTSTVPLRQHHADLPLEREGHPRAQLGAARGAG